MFIELIKSISLTNKYQKWYISICTNAKNRSNIDIYFEKHHIVPKSLKLGGEKDPSNIVKLTLKEHFVCHLLLTKMFTGTNKAKMCYAVQRMLHSKNQASRHYSIFRLMVDRGTRGSNHHNFGKTLTDSTKAKISSSLTGRKNGPQSKELKQKRVTNRKNNNKPWHSKETALKIGKANSGENNGNYGKIWINNGLESIRIFQSDPIPTGWVKGRLTPWQGHS